MYKHCTIDKANLGLFPKNPYPKFLVAQTGVRKDRENIFSFLKKIIAKLRSNF